MVSPSFFADGCKMTFPSLRPSQNKTTTAAHTRKSKSKKAMVMRPCSCCYSWCTPATHTTKLFAFIFAPKMHLLPRLNWILLISTRKFTIIKNCKNCSNFYTFTSDNFLLNFFSMVMKDKSTVILKTKQWIHSPQMSHFFKQCLFANILQNFWFQISLKTFHFFINS